METTVTGNENIMARLKKEFDDIQKKLYGFSSPIFMDAVLRDNFSQRNFTNTLDEDALGVIKKSTNSRTRRLNIVQEYSGDPREER